jgi:hypothetical protein
MSAGSPETAPRDERSRRYASTTHPVGRSAPSRHSDVIAFPLRISYITERYRNLWRASLPSVDARRPLRLSRSRMNERAAVIVISSVSAVSLTVIAAFRVLMHLGWL